MTQPEVIQRFMKSLDETSKQGKAALDEAIKACSTFNGFDDIKASIIEDCKNAKSADDFLKTYCGIDLDNDDTGAITGWDAGGSTVKTKNSIVPESGSLNDSPDNEFTVNGFTIKLADKPHSTFVGVHDDFTYVDWKKLPDDTQKYIWKATCTWWANGALKLITESYGENFGYYDKDSTTVKEIAFGFVNMDNGDLAATSGWTVDSYKTITKLAITVNMNAYKSIIINNVDGKLSDEDNFYLDRTLAHEFTHAVMQANINNYFSLPQFIREGMAELTHGIDDERRSYIESLAKDADELGKWLDTSNTNTGQTRAYVAGYMLLRYLARQAGDLTIENTSDSTVRTFRGNDSVTNSADDTTIDSGAGDDYLYNNQGARVTMNGGADDDALHNYIGNSLLADAGAGNDYFNNYQGKSVTVDGGEGNDYLQNIQGTNVSLFGGAGSDTLVNQGNTVTLSGGADNDSIRNVGSSNVLFQYASGDGNDTISGFNATSTLQIGDGSGTYSDSINGDDLIVTVGNGKISLVGAASLSSVNIDGKRQSTQSGGSSIQVISHSGDRASITVTGKTSSVTSSGNRVTIKGGDGSDTIYSNGASVSIDAGAGNDLISNDQSNKVTMLGGAGDDTLWNWSTDDTASSGANVSMNGGTGNDTIYNSGDSATIDAGTGSDTVYNNGYDVSINAGNGNDSISNYGWNVTISGGADNDTIYNNWNFSADEPYDDSDGSNVLFKYTAGDGNDLIQGFRADSTLSISGGNYSSVKSGSDILVSVGDGTITLSGAASLSSVNILGKLEGGDDEIISLTSGSDRYTNKTAGATIQALGGADKIINTTAAKNALIDLGAGNDSITNSGSNVTVLGGTGNDTIRNYAGGKNSSLNGGDGSDKLYNSATNVTLLGGGGNDMISLSSAAKNNLIAYSDGDGSDTVYGFNATSTLSIGDGFGEYSTTKSGSNIVVTVGNSKIILSKAASLSSIHIDGTERHATTTKKFYNSSSAKVTLTSDVDIADATVRYASKPIQIVGNARDNSILGGKGKDSLYGRDGDDYLVGNAGNDKLYGQDGDDTLWGGAGNDTLIGGDGDDTFIYNSGEGKDTITDFDDDDMLQITGTWSAAYYKVAGKVSFTVGGTAGAIVLKDFAATTFNVNGEAYRISGTKLVKR